MPSGRFSWERELVDPHPLERPRFVAIRLEQTRQLGDGLREMRFQERTALTIDARRAVFANH